MKIRKKFIAGFLSVAMIATSFQFPAGSVQAEERKEEITQEAVVGEDAENTRENVSESTTDTERSSSTSSESTEVTEENSSASSEGTEVPEIEESKEIETSAETMESENQKEKSESENTEQETKDNESETCEEESIIEEISTEEEETEAEISLNAFDNSIAEGSYGNITWSIDADGKLLVEGTGEFSDSVGTERAPWYGYRDNIKSAEINVTEMTNASYMFYGCKKMKSVDLDKFDTSNVTGMYNMFDGCILLQELDLSKFNTAKVTSMTNMFRQCASLTSLDLKSFDTQNVDSMNGMFQDCYDLENVDLSSFDTRNVYDMENMFQNCGSLISLNLSSFDTKSVINMSNMFQYCGSLKSVNLSNFNTRNVLFMGYMFQDCKSLESIDLSNLTINSGLSRMAYMFSGCSSLTSIDMSNMHIHNIVDENGNPINEEIDMQYMFSGCNNLVDVKLSSLDTININSMCYMFSDCSELIDLDLSGFNISGVQNMSYMFSGCSGLEKLNLQNFNTSDADDMECMFYNCSSLINLDLSGFSTTEVLNMYQMFMGCSSLESIDLSSFDTQKEPCMTRLFSGCSSLKSLDLSSFNMGLAYANGMFENCSCLMTINTPRNVMTSIELPTDSESKWYNSAEEVITELPINLDYSVQIVKKIRGGTYKGITWSIDADGKLTVEGSGEFSDSTGAERAPWYSYRQNIYSAVVEVTGMTDASYMFYGCESLYDINLAEFDTSNLTNMQGMFEDCYNLYNLDLSEFDTSNVTNMNSAFKRCGTKYGLIRLDVSKFNTSKVTDMSSMFEGCTYLYSIDLTEFDTSNVTDMSSMFKDCTYLSNSNAGLDGLNTSKVTNIESIFEGCSNLQSLDLSSFNTSNVTNMKSVFKDCSNLYSLDLSKFDTRKVTDMGGMFSGCNKLSSLELSSFDISKVVNMKSMFSGCSSLVSLDLSKFNVVSVTNMETFFEGCDKLSEIYTPYNVSCTVALPDNTNYVWYNPDGAEITELPQNMDDSIKIVRKANGTYENILWSIDENGKLTIKGTGEFSDSTGAERAPWYSYREDIYSVVVEVTGMTDASYMFYGCSNLSKGDLKGFDTSNVTNMRSMFQGCHSMFGLDLSGFDTSNVTDMGMMFRESGLSSDNGLGSFDTSNVTNMSWMFMNCRASKLDLSSFNTSNVTDMIGMFYDCNNLKEVNLSSFNTSNVTNMRVMFQNCRRLSSMDLSNFDTSKVQDMSQMFEDCVSLSNLNLSSFNTENVETMCSMFSNCKKLESLNITSFNVPKVWDVEAMFYGCESLRELDLSKFNPNLQHMRSMFEGCSSLTDLDLSHFNTSAVADLSWVFKGCSSLKSLDLSSFKTTRLDCMGRMFENCSNLTKINLCSFDTSKVESMAYAFKGCSKLTSLDLSNFDANRAYVDGMLSECNSLIMINIPYNLSYTLELPTNPGDVWYKADGTVITEVPTELSYSITIARNKVPTVEASHITANKRKTVYKTGDTLNIDDLAVMYHDNDGTIRKVTDFSTNADEIDMSVPGTKTLIVTYNDLKAEVELTVEKEGEEPTEKEKVTISGIEMADSTYTGKSVSFNGKTVVTSKDEKDITENVTLTYSYSGKQADGSDYAVTDKAPVNAGEYKLTVAVSEDNENYTGSSEYAFTIEQAPITITAQDKELAVGSPVPESYEYEITGILNEDKLIKEPSFICNAEMDKAGTYEIVPQDADAGMNYKISYGKGTLTLKENPPEKGNVTISGIEVPDIVYNGKEASYVGTALVTSQDGKNVTESVALTYTYSGKQADGSDYAVTDRAPVNAGEYKLTVAVSEDNENYTGSSEYTFSIAQAPTEITALDEELVIGSPAPESYQYRVDGLLNEDKLIKEPLFTCNVDMEKVGTYEIIPHDADAGMNYKITYNKGTLTVTENGIRYTVSFDLAGHGTAIASVKNVRSGSLIEEPKQPVDQGYRFMGWYKDKLCTEAWDFAKDMVESDITLYACWLTESSGNEGADLCIQEIQTQTYTGKAIKPSVLVYSTDGITLLKSGKDYVIKYYNNTEADTDAEVSLGGTSQTGKEGDNGFSQKLAYVCITGKGNYEGTVYRNFHIAPVSITGNDGNLANGAVLKYSEQLTVNNSKAQKPFSSLKYKKNMKAGVDFEVKLTALEAYDAGGHVLSGVAIDESNLIPSIPAGYKGSFSLSIKGINNYSGEVSRKVYVSEKAHLMKNATITLGKNLKNMEYTGQSITLTPAYYDASAKKYYAIDASGAVSTQAEPNGDNVFTVRIGKEYLIYGKDYSISYTNNCASGSATMTVAGTGDYAGTKDIKFKISGKAFSAKQISVENLQSVMTYTGKAVTQDNVVLKMNGRELVCGKDYTVTYKNNLKKGTASMIFKAVEESGYSGSFTTKFKIGAAELKDTVKVIPIDSSFGDNVVYDNAGIKLIGTVPYSKEGAKISDRVSLTNGSNTLKEGIDYTVSYVNNQSVTVGTNSIATMNIKGKGNYSGNLSVQFVITEAPMEENQNLTVVATATPYNSGKADSYQYQPKIKITDGKKVLSAQTDYVVEYRNCTQSAVKAYLEALKKDTSTEDMKPQAVISAKTGSGYIGSVTTDLTIYEEKLTAKNLYIVVSDVTEQITYNGSQVKPEIMVYYGDSKAVKEAKTANEKDEKVLTDKSGTYCLTKLAEKSDYVVSYGSNSIAGKNKGNVTVTGIGMYGGNVKIAFTILRRDVYGEK